MTGTITELRPAQGPAVYGFLRLVKASKARQHALSASLVDYCAHHELSLSGIFMERCTVTNAELSPAFAGLTDALRTPGAYAVVAPTTAHLGFKPLALARTQRIQRLGIRLMLIRGKVPRLDARSGRGFLCSPLVDAEG
ncbi:hypothetical protein [Streptodolium elevatio]